MTVETYIYAMVGIHCKDQCTTKTESVRGCGHPDTWDKYCAVCGKKMWIKNTVEHHASDKLEHLQEWYGGEDDNGRDDNNISMIYSPMTGPDDFVVGRVLEDFDSDTGGHAVPFNILTDEEYTAAYEETKAALEPLGLWDAEKFGYMLYAISM